jgi:hypothetical protein
MVEPTEDIPRYIVPESLTQVPRTVLEVREENTVILALYEDGTSAIDNTKCEEAYDLLVKALTLVAPRGVEALAFITSIKPTEKSSKEEG